MTPSPADQPIEVKVTFVGLIRQMTGSQDQTIYLSRESTLEDLFEKLIDQVGPGLRARLLEKDGLAPFTTVLINGENAGRLGGLQTPLGEAATAQVEIIVLSAPFMGG